MPSNNLTVIARFKAKQGKEETALVELSALLDPTREEGGCLQYDLHRSSDDSSVFVFYETWKSRQDLELHLAKPYLQALLGQVDELFAEAPQIDLLERVDLV